MVFYKNTEKKALEFEIEVVMQTQYVVINNFGSLYF